MKATLPANRDLQIIRCLVADPKATRLQIAQATGIPESTVQRRLRHLLDSGVLSYHLSLASQNKFFPTRALISINIDPSTLSSMQFGYHHQPQFVSFLKWALIDQKEFAPFMSDVVIETVEIVLGGHSDVILVVSAIDAVALSDFVTRVLRKLPGVMQTNTATLVSYPKAILKSETTGTKSTTKRK